MNDQQGLYQKTWDIIHKRRIFLIALVGAAIFAFGGAPLFPGHWKYTVNVLLCIGSIIYMKSLDDGEKHIKCPRCGELFFQFNVFKKNCQHCGLPVGTVPVNDSSQEPNSTKNT